MRKSSEFIGINEVISVTLQALQAFPDRKGSGWSVIWSGNEEDGFFTSHRGRSIATNTGDLLAQAEHDPNARAILVSTSRLIAEQTIQEIKNYLKEFPLIPLLTNLG